MRLEITDGKINVFLSKRNLLALLTKLNHPESHCSIESGHVIVEGKDVSTISPPFRVTSEQDEAHYAHPARINIPPGEMIGFTEEDISQHIQDENDGG